MDAHSLSVIHRMVELCVFITPTRPFDPQHSHHAERKLVEASVGRILYLLWVHGCMDVYSSTTLPLKKESIHTSFFLLLYLPHLYSIMNATLSLTIHVELYLAHLHLIMIPGYHSDHLSLIQRMMCSM